MPTYRFETDSGESYRIESAQELPSEKIKSFAEQVGKMHPATDAPKEEPSTFGQRTKEAVGEVGQAYKGLAPVGKVLGALPGLITPSPTAFKQRLNTIVENAPKMAQP